MVRGPAALLGVLGAALAYFLAAPILPELQPENTSIIVAAACGLAFVVALAAGMAPATDAPVVLVLAVPGAALLVAALNVADVGAGATPAEAILFGCVGVGFAVVLDTAALALALPVFVAALDAASVLGGGPTTLFTEGMTQPGDPLSLELPDWGNGLPALRLGIADVVFAGVFAAYARHFGLRLRSTAFCMWLALCAAVVVKLELDRAVPALPFLAAGYFLPNLDKLPGLFRLARQG